MSEIVNELRRLAPLDHSRVLGDVMRQAADEIERLIDINVEETKTWCEAMDHSHARYLRLNEKLVKAEAEIKRLQNNMWEVNEQSEFRACQIDKLDAELAECRRLLQEASEHKVWTTRGKLETSMPQSWLNAARKAAGGE